MNASTVRRCRLTVLAAVSAAIVLLAPAVPDAATAEADPAPPAPIAGFVRSPSGDYRTIAFPGAATLTIAFGINNRGQVVGYYDDAAGRTHGFVRGPHGRYRTIDFPGAYATAATRINDRGQIIGDYFSTKKRFEQGLKRGFLLDHGRFTKINVPGSDSTEAVGLNDHGRVVGETGTYEPLDLYGYRWNDGRIRRIDAPRAAFTGAEEINERGQIVGTYGTDLGVSPTRGYLLDRGRFKTFAARNGRSAQVFGLNNRGQIVGYTLSGIDSTDERGFLLAKGVGGPFTPINVPGATRTIATGINDRGQVVGAYERPAGTADTQRGGTSQPMLALLGPQTPDPKETPIRSPGFTYIDGRYTTVQVPRSRTHTYLHGINDQGRIAGGFDNPSTDGPDGRIHGIVRGLSGRIVRFDVRGAIATLANKINDRGQVVGGFNTTDVSVGAPGTKGFLRGPRGLTRINVPGSIETQALGVNNLGVVVGEYVDADGVFHGFRWKRGRLTTIDVPGPVGGTVTDINDRGHMVGTYVARNGALRGFLLRGGVYRTFNVPYGPLDLPFDINNRGQIVGASLSDPTGTRSVGFVLRRGIDGPFTRIRFPGSPQTIARGIDDRGRIVGLYGNPDTAPSTQRGGVRSAPLDVLPLGLTGGPGVTRAALRPASRSMPSGPAVCQPCGPMSPGYSGSPPPVGA
jgi:uncharacterized membrane protein